MRILLAEDDEVLADGLCRALRGAGHAVDHVADGSQADAAVGLHDYDLLILDLGLPRLAGDEVLRRMRSRNAGTPVLVLTAADSVQQRVRMLDLGADDFMAKPFALSELEARVRALVRRAQGPVLSLRRASGRGTRQPRGSGAAPALRGADGVCASGADGRRPHGAPR